MVRVVMTSFLNPTILNYYPVLIVFIALLFFYAYHNRRKLLRITGTKDNIYWYMFTGAKILLVILLFIAAAAPVNIVERKVNVTGRAILEEARAVMVNVSLIHAVLIDVSKSMLYTDNDNITRFEEALEAARDYIELLNKTSEKVMLIKFSGTVNKTCICSPGEALKKLETLKAGEKYTSMTSALTYTLNYLKIAQLPAVILVISDGANNYGGEPYNAFLEANRSGYPVVFIRVGFDERANKLVRWLKSNGFRVYSYNEYTKDLVEKLIKRDIWSIRVDAFYAKKIIRLETGVREIDPSPSMIILLTAIILAVIIKLEGV